MKIITKIYLILILLSTSCIYSQSRQNIEFSPLLNRSSKITSGVGWEFNAETGKWVSNKNAIYRSVLEPFWRNHIDSNFIWLQSSEIKLNNEHYYVLLYESNSGYYTYPNIQEDWVNTLTTKYFIFSESDRNLIQNAIQEQDGKTYFIPALKYGSITDKFHKLGGEHAYTDENLTATINNDKFSKSNFTKYVFIFNIQEVDGEKVARFLLPNLAMSINPNFRDPKLTLATLNATTRDKINKESEENGTSNIYSILNYSYFEISLSDFSKLFNF